MGALEKLFHPDSYWRDALALARTGARGRRLMINSRSGAREA